MTSQKKRPRDESSEETEQNLTIDQPKNPSALITAARYGQNDLVRKLIDAKVHPDTVCQNGRTPLYYAVIFGHTETVRLLLSLGADAPIDYTRNSYLHHAARQGYTDIMQVLGCTPKGGEIQIPYSILFMLFDEVTIFGQVKALELLIERFPALPLHFIDGQSLSNWARNTAQMQILEAISKFIPALKENFSELEQFMQLGAQKKFQDFQRRQRKGEKNLPGLVDAISSGNEQLLELLLNSKSDIEADNALEDEEGGRPLTGGSALIVAAKYNRIKMVEMLLKAKANINKVNLDGQTALDCAQNNPAIKRLLEMHGAKPLLMGLQRRAGASSILTYLDRRSSLFDRQVLRLPLRLAGTLSPLRPKISTATFFSTLETPGKKDGEPVIPTAAFR